MAHATINKAELSWFGKAIESIKEHGFKTLTIAAIGGAALTGCADQSEAPEPTPISTEVSQTERIQDIVDARPKQGSEEYNKMFESLRIPYIEGQKPEDVLLAFMKSVDTWTKIAYDDLSQISYDDQTNWAIENMTASREATVEGIVEQADIEYYTSGAAEAIWGPAKNTEFGQMTIRNFEELRKQFIVEAMLLNDPISTEEFLVSASVDATPTDIHATFTGYNGNRDSSNPTFNNYPAHLQKTMNEDGSYSWYLVG